MTSFSKLPSLPLKKILGFMDLNSRENLIIATRRSDVGLHIQSMTSKRKFLCPVCVFEAGPRNIINLGRKNPEKGFLRHIELDRLETLNFYSQFRHLSSGNENYSYEADCVTEDEEVQYVIQRCFRDLKDYKQIRFFGKSYKEHEHWFASNYIDVLKSVKPGNKFHQTEQTRLERIFFGLTYKGVTIESGLKTYSKEEFQKHVRGHYMPGLTDDVDFDEWIESFDSLKRFEADPSWYDVDGTIETEQLEELLECMMISNYYQHVRLFWTRTKAEQLGTKKEYMWREIHTIFKVARGCFERIRFPKKSFCQSDIGLLKYIDIYNLSLDAIINHM